MIRLIPHSPLPMQLIVLALIWLSGCTGQQQAVRDTRLEHKEMGEAVQSWIGLSQTEIQEMLGPRKSE